MVATALWVFRGALPYFFAQDDFEGLARADGILPRLNGAWRLIGNQYYYDLMALIAGHDPLIYRIASLGLHAGVSLLVYCWLLPFVSVPAAMLGAAFFATHPALYTSLDFVCLATDGCLKPIVEPKT